MGWYNGAAVSWIRIPDRVLPRPGIGELPEPVALRRMLGPSVILVGLSIGSGEFVLWPRLTAEWGFALFWACWVGVTLQFFLNMEIERFTLATGESAVLGFVRLSRFWAPVFLVCATLPWVWPGWATGAATLIHWETGLPVTASAIAGLVVCGLVLSVGPVVYRTVETLQFVLVTLIFAALVVLALLVVRADTLAELGAGALRFGSVPEGVHLPMLLGALAFAGAGGSVNLAQSNYIKDKGYGMGCHIGRITSPFTGRDEPTGDVGKVFEPTEENLARWRVWWRRTNLEHFASFYVLALLSLALFCLVAASLLPEAGEVAPDFEFLGAEAAALEERFGGWARRVFLATGVAVLFSTELALLDAVARVAADLLRVGLQLYAKLEVGLSRLYFGVLWVMIGFGAMVLLAGFDQPLTLIVLSAALNAFVMFLYSGLLLWLNLTTFHGPLRPHPVRVVALVFSLCFFGYFSALTLADRLGVFG
ncbi:MAG: Nramp family divalent metal transporter [Deltaproteobacteria bacterium]|nr:Nramp family divalent metal transporter [Deltaproteobacteria bacterium]